VLPSAGLVLEVASGTGQHVVHFARALPALEWLPSDADPAMVEAIESRLETEPLRNIRAPLRLEVHDRPWPIECAAAVVCCNMIHIAPWSAGEALLAGAAAVLAPGGPLILYGPFRVPGRATAPSNEAFDASLRTRNPAWGLRDLGEVTRTAAAYGFALDETVEMPANNLTVVLRRG
jgi:SAM-dependent methyltransferase